MAHPAAAVILLMLAVAAVAQYPLDTLQMRAPAVPLVVRDQFFSQWSRNDNLTDDYTVHWTIAESARGYKAMSALVRIDSKTFRLMGPDCIGIPPLQQLGYARVYPTTTLYRFAGAGVALNMTWAQPWNASDFDSWLPYAYITFDVAATDGAPHSVQVYFDATGQLTVNEDSETLVWARDTLTTPGAQSMRMGTAGQPVLQGFGDDFRINWGYLHLSVLSPATTAMASSNLAKYYFASNGTLPSDETSMPVATCPNATGNVCGCVIPGHTGWDNDWPSLAAVLDVSPAVDGAGAASRWVVLSYDDVDSINMFGVVMREYWRRNGATFNGLLDELLVNYSANAAMAVAMDVALVTEWRTLGLGEKYERLASLSYRQTLADNKLVWYNGTFGGVTPPGAMLFVKGADSSGDTGTLDDNLPAYPLFALSNARLIEAFIAPLMLWATNETYSGPGAPFPRNMTYGWPYSQHAPHYLGQHPVAMLQCWFPPGFVQWCEPMPLEMSADMLLLLTAAARETGDFSFIERYFATLDSYATYLVDNGLFPASQRSSDDYMGFIVNSTHLAAKAILGIAAWARVCNATGRVSRAAALSAVAVSYRDTWLALAMDATGAHTTLTYGANGSYSIKYSLLFDATLDLRVFGPELAALECAWHDAKALPFGWRLQAANPPSNAWTNLGWEEWFAALCAPDVSRALYASLYAYATTTPQRVALGDWYDASTAQWQGFTARAQVGGIFASPLLARQRAAAASAAAAA